MTLLPGFLLRALLPRFAAPPRRAAAQRGRSARVALGVGLATVVAAQLGLGVAVETARPEWRDPEYGHRLKQLQALAKAHPARPLVVAVGSSRTQMGLSPLAMGFPDRPGSPLVYNFGQAGAVAHHVLLTTLRLLDAGVKPDFLLVEVYPLALARDGPAEEVLAAWGPRLGLGDIGRLGPYWNDPRAVRRAWAADRVVPWSALRESLMFHALPEWLPYGKLVYHPWHRMDDRGFVPFGPGNVPAPLRAAWLDRTRAVHAPVLADYGIGATSDRALRDTLARCRADGIAAALVVSPESPAYRGWYAPATRDRLAVYLGAIRREYGVPVFDAPDGFAEDEFADGHHLLPAGAARFSRRLADEHLRPWIRAVAGGKP